MFITRLHRCQIARELRYTIVTIQPILLLQKYLLYSEIFYVFSWAKSDYTPDGI